MNREYVIDNFKRIGQARWFKYPIEVLTLTFLVGLVGGVALGLLRGWEYASNGLFSVTLDALRLSVNESVLVVFIPLVLYLAIFLVLYRMIRHAKWSSLISSAFVLLPLLLFLGYRINKINHISWSNFFRHEAIIFNLKVGIGFILLWLLVSIGLFIWTRWRILKTTTFSINGLGALLGIVLVFNASMLLFHRMYATDSPNVIILLIDALRADRLSCYGNSRNTSPNIDKFAKDSVLFTQAISQSTFTKTSVSSLFTSLYPYQHGVYEGNTRDTENNITSDVLGEEEMTLAEVLLQNGFLTMAWVHNAQLRSYMGFAEGFVEYDEPAGDIKSINKRFIRWIDWIGKRHRFFAYIHYLDLHDPYRPKPPYDTMYGVYSDVYSEIDFKDWGRHRKEIRENKRKLEKKDIDQLLAYYDGQLTYIDSQIGLLLEYLKKEGLYDNTLIIITADHGDGFMEHGFISHSNTPYDELLRVPLIIKFPKSVYAGKVVRSQVRLIDVMPTILDYLGIRTDSELSGFSLLNYLDDNRNKGKKIDFPKYAISEHHNTLSIRTEKYKYIHSPNKEDEFYDLSVDPKERNNIIDLRRDEAERFRKMALKVAQERKEKNTRKAVLDKKTVEELKALGYVQ